MNEYIDRDAVVKMLENSQIISDGENCGYCIDDISIYEIPAADVSPIVRCKDCIYYRQPLKTNDFNEAFTGFPDDSFGFLEVVYRETGDCKLHPHNDRVNANYFCADGDRRHN